MQSVAKSDYKLESYSNLKIKMLTSIKPMEAAILNILLASGKFWKINKITYYIANCTDIVVFFKSFFSIEEAMKIKTKIE